MFVLYPFFFFFFCKKKLYSWPCGKQRRREKVMSRHLMPLLLYLVRFFFLSFQCFLLYPFFTHCIFQYKNTHGKANGDTPLGVRLMTCLVNSFYPLFVNFDLISGHASSELLDFFEHNLILFFACSLHPTSSIAISIIFDITDIGVTDPSWGYILTILWLYFICPLNHGYFNNAI